MSVYPCYVRVGETADTEEFVEVPTEKDGTLLLSTITAQFPDAVGLRFKAESGALRGVRCNEGAMDPPPEGWGDVEYFVIKKTLKRKIGGDDGSPLDKLRKMGGAEVPDLIMLGLPYTATKEDIKKHFEQFGELEWYEIKYDSSKKSRGFGFIRYKNVEAVEKALKGVHTIHNRRVTVQFPKEGPKQQHDDVETKLFIGRIPRGSTTEDLRKHFSEYGVLKDVYIPTPFRGFGFVTFSSQVVAHEVMKASHTINGAVVNVANSSPKHEKIDYQNQNQNQGYGNQNPAFGNQNAGIGNQNPGFGFQNQGFGNQNPGYGMYGNNMHGGNNLQPPVGAGYGGYGNLNAGYTAKPTITSGNYGWTKP